MSLPAKQARFVEEYLVDMNATAAAGRAGYSDPNYGRQLLTHPNVAAAIAEAQSERSDRVQITQDMVLKELARIGFADIRDLFTWDERKAAFVPSHDLTPDQSASIAEVNSETLITHDTEGRPRAKIKLKLKTYDKVSALDKIGRHLGMFIDRVEHSGNVGVPGLTVILKRDDDASDG